MYATELVTAPSGAVLTTQQGKDHLRVSGTDDDTYIDLLVSMATLRVENFLGRKLITQTWKVFFDNFPTDYCPLEFPFGKVTSVTHVKYYDSDGVLTTLDSSLYQTEFKSIGRLGLAPAVLLWPATQQYKFNAVEVQFIVGYANAAAVPEDIKHAMKLMIGAAYDLREDEMKIPKAAEYLMSPYRLVSF